MNYMADAEDLKHLLRSLERLTDALESQSASGATYQTRAGRGGNSNRETVGSTNLNKGRDQLRKATEQYEAMLRKSSNAVESWKTAIHKAAGLSELFGARMYDVINAMDDMNDTQTVNSRKITKSTLELIRANGLQGDAMKKANNNAYAFADAAHALIARKNEKAKIEAVPDRIKALKDEKNNAIKNGGSRNNKELIKAIDEEINELKQLQKTLPAVDAALVTLQEKVNATGAAARDTVPALIGMETAVDLVTTSTTGQIAEMKDLTAVVGGLSEGMKAQENVQKATMQMEQDHIAKLGAARTQMLDGLKSIGKGLVAATGGLVNDFREQLKNNVKQSNYGDAISMGLSETQLTQSLGANAETFSGASGSGDRSALLLNGTLQSLQKTVTALYGESGPEAMQRIAQVMATSQQTGFNTKDPTMVSDRLKNFSDISDHAQMTKGAFTDFMSDLSSSGDALYLSSMFQNKGTKEAQDALDHEIEARLINNKMIGLSSEQTKKQIQAERATHFGTMENMFQNIMSGNMDMAIAKQDGVQASPEVAAIVKKKALGMTLSAPELKTYSDYKLQAQGAMIDKTDAASASNDTRAALQQGGYRGISPNGMFSGSALADAQAQRALMDSKYSKEEQAKFTKDGTWAKMYQQAGGAASDPNSTTSTLLPFAQSFNSLMTLIDGLKLNTILSYIGAGVWATAAATIKMALWGMKGGLPGNGPGGGPQTFPGSGIKDAMAAEAMTEGATTASTMGAGVKFAAKGAGSILSGVFGAVTGGYEGYADSKGRGETTAHAVTDAAGGAIGGGVGGWGGAAIGGALGVLGGPLAPLTIPLGMAIGGALGASVGGKVGETVADAAFNAVDGTKKGAPDSDGFSLSKVFSPDSPLGIMAMTFPPLALATAGAASAFSGIESFFTGDKSPTATLGNATADAAKQREANFQPTKVEVVGASGAALATSAENSSKIADASKAQVGESQKANSRANTMKKLGAIHDAQLATVATSKQQMQDMQIV
jgi:hypothetical protein